METLQCELEPFLQLDSLVNFAIKKQNWPSVRVSQAGDH